MGIFKWRKRPKDEPQPEVADANLYKTFPAYQVTSWPEVQNHLRTLERIARRVNSGQDLEAIEAYHEGQYDFSFSSPHFQAACHGDPEASTNYHREVADGKYWIFD